ncbi:DUF2284 domain-containing protein [Alkalithermobacter paradoxus]|uniref:Metal-binding protein n=1 Tax=Alkalithermobacter paradoxus TaxID=29349 RepID=A0A1V4I6C1_9FIRM|nr:hypothetical protein CLOTH_12740 [[Clostridium] thermoalcaliphilum]
MEKLLELSRQNEITPYFIDTKDIIVEDRVYLKCAYGCKDFGKRLNCPPNIITIDEFRRILKEYEKGLVLIEEYYIDKDDDIYNTWEIIRKNSFHKMIEIEKEAFRQGYSFAHLLRAGSCNECPKCSEQCSKPYLRRFSPESVGINLTKTLENINITINYDNTNKITLIGLLLLY